MCFAFSLTQTALSPKFFFSPFAKFCLPYWRPPIFEKPRECNEKRKEKKNNKKQILWQKLDDKWYKFNFQSWED